jgi:hypothetical protein
MSNTEVEQTQVYRVSLSVDIKVCGGNDKGRRISAEEYVNRLICYPLYESDSTELQGVGWHGVDDWSTVQNYEGHAPYQMDSDLYNVNFKSIRKVGPIEYEDNSNRWTKEDENKEGHPW